MLETSSEKKIGIKEYLLVYPRSIPIQPSNESWCSKIQIGDREGLHNDILQLPNDGDIVGEIIGGVSGVVASRTSFQCQQCLGCSLNIMNNLQ